MLNGSNRLTMAVLIVAGLFAWQSAGGAIIGTYVDADGGVGGNTVNASTDSATDWFVEPPVNDDGLWGHRVDGALPTVIEGGDIWEANAADNDVPEIATTITGMDAGEIYALYVVYVGRPGSTSNWAVGAGLTSGALTMYDDDVSNPAITATGKVSTTVAAQYQAYLGTVSGVTEATVYVDYIDQGLTDDRAWYDGVAYEIVPEPASMALLGLGTLVMLRRRRTG